MKVRVIEVEGSPEELANFNPDWLSAGKPAAPAADSEHETMRRDAGATTADGAESAAVSGPELAPEVRDLIQKDAPGKSGELVDIFVREVLRWNAVYAGRGKSRLSSNGFTDYFGLHRRGSPKGAFAYVRPASARVTLRLQKAAADGYKHAAALTVREANVYKVAVYLASEGAVAEAIELARKAYEDV